MSFEVGNQLWQLRLRSGVPRKFETPDQMLEMGIEYFKWAQANPLQEMDFRGKDATEVTINKMRALSWAGLCLFLGVGMRYFVQFRLSLDDREDEISRDFSTVISYFETVMYEQKFSGAAAGLLNPNIIARDLGLADKSEINSTITKNENLVSYTDLSDDALKEIENASKQQKKLNQ